MSVSNTSLPKPKNWQDFEIQTRELFACVLNDPNTQKNGRSGQKQSGVDVYGYRYPGHLVGIQCKLEDAATEGELRAELEKAKTFKPRISEFILITTAPRDQKIQESARIITTELAQTDHPIVVSVWGWEDVEEQAPKYPSAWKAFEPTWSSFAEQGFEKLSLKIDTLTQTISRSGDETRFPSSNPTDVNLEGSDQNTPRHGQITTLQALIDKGHVQAALDELFKLKTDEWISASKSERYRILVGIASAKLKLGEQNEAASVLLDAYAEYPGHKNAEKNRAKAYLIKNDSNEAAKLARKMLAQDKSNADAAGTLIQALIPDPSCDDPLREVPEALHEEEDVLVARIHFLRCRGSRDWVSLAKRASEKHPQSRLLKLFSAEAVLDELVRANRDVIAGGTLKTISPNELSNAVETLYTEVRTAIEKGYSLPPSLAHNAALGLRFTDDLTRAKEVLDAAIMRFPDDEGLRLQRAIIAYSRNDPAGALAVLPNKPSNPDAIGIRASALAATGKLDDALLLIDDTDEETLPKHVKTEFLAIRTRAYIARGEKELAINTIAQRVAAGPNNLSLRILQIRTHRIIGDENGANRAFDAALASVNDQTSLPSRLELSFEAGKFGRDDAVVDLLSGRVAMDRESEGLHILIGASINSGLLVTAREILSAVSQHLRDRDWFQRTDAIIAFNTGDPTANEKIARYLKRRPNDGEMILARIGIWQRAGRDGDIRLLLLRLSLTDLDARPEQRIRIAGLIVRYGEALRGLKYAYSVLMDNWNIPEAHLAYQALIFLNDDIGAVMPSTIKVTENTVVCLVADGSERRYRIEKEQHKFFENERLDPASDLALLLIGKEPGDKFNPQDRIGSKPLEVRWIKPVYLDAFHCSLDQFNERFPRAHGPQKFTFNTEAPDPLEDVRAITKARAEADQRILDEYQSKNIPLSFAAALIGKDPLEAWNGLPTVRIPFRVCHGTSPEREQALHRINKHGRKGCVLDAITLSAVRRLGVEKAIAAVCGPIHIPQSVIDLLASRALEAKQDIGKKQGFIGWRDNRLVLEEFSQDFLQKVADEREKEVSWARGVSTVAPAMPKKDFAPKDRPIMSMVGHVAYDPAVTADGNDLLLLSEDMGFRTWTAETFNVPTTWLQPVLMTALNERHLTKDEYCEAINMLVFSGHTYISLDHNCLMHEARKNNFAVTTELSRLLGTIGGASADLRSNTKVISAFLDALWQECTDELKVKRIASEVFYTFPRGRQEDLRLIILSILKQMRIQKMAMYEHALSWLIFNSMGMPYSDELRQLQNEMYAKMSSPVDEDEKV